MAPQSLSPYSARPVEPFRSAGPLLSFYQQANRLFEDVFREFDDARETFSGILTPSIDVSQNDHETRIVAEMPGVRQEDIEVSVDHDVLTIRAEKRSERDETKDTNHVRERSFGTFQRSLRLQQQIDPEQVRANFDQGVLTVTIPRAPYDQSRRKIAIENGATSQVESQRAPKPQRERQSQESQ